MTEKRQYHDLLSMYSDYMKKSWGVIKSIINKNQKTHIQGRFKIGKNLITSHNELISNKFYDFFINIGPTLAKSIPRINKSSLSYLGNCLTETIYAAPVNEKEIGQLIKSLKDTAAGFDDLNSMCLKVSSQFLVKALTHFCKLSLSRKVFFQNSWRLQMLSFYIKVMIPCCSTTTDLYLYYVFCQRSSKRLCITRLQLSLRYLKFYMVINMDLGRSHQLMWHYWLI